MTHGMLVLAGRSSSVRVLMLRCVLSSDAPRRVADQVHYPEDAVAEQQRAGEQHGQMLDAEWFRRWTPSLARDTGDGGSPFVSPFGSYVRLKTAATLSSPSRSAQWLWWPWWYS